MADKKTRVSDFERGWQAAFDAVEAELRDFILSGNRIGELHECLAVRRKHSGNRAGTVAADEFDLTESRHD